MARTTQNPYAPPAAAHAAFRPDLQPTSDDAELDRLLAQTQVTPVVKVAIGTVAALGALLLGNALQLWGIVSLYGPVRFAPFVMLALGLLFLVLGVKIYRQRPWAAVSALALCVLTALVTALWFLLSTASGFLSLLALLLPFVATAGAVLAGLAIGPCLHTASARRRLAASGLPVDF